MAKPTVVINGITYALVPQVSIPKQGGGTADFYYAGDTNVSAADIRNGKVGVNSTGEVVGNMTEKSAASYNPSSSDQIINANQFLAGAQTIKAVTTSNLLAQYIASGITIKVGCAADDDCVASVTGSLSSAVISQDGVTKVLSIS